MVISFMNDNKVTEPPAPSFSVMVNLMHSVHKPGDCNTTHDNVILDCMLMAGIKNMANHCILESQQEGIQQGNTDLCELSRCNVPQGPSAKNFDFILCEGAEIITHTVARSDGTTAEMSVSSNC